MLWIRAPWRCQKRQSWVYCKTISYWLQIVGSTAVRGRSPAQPSRSCWTAPWLLQLLSQNILLWHHSGLEEMENYTPWQPSLIWCSPDALQMFQTTNSHDPLDHAGTDGSCSPIYSLSERVGSSSVRAESNATLIDLMHSFFSIGEDNKQLTYKGQSNGIISRPLWIKNASVWLPILFHRSHIESVFRSAYDRMLGSGSNTDRWRRNIRSID